MSWHKSTLGHLGRVITGKTPSRARPDYFGDEHPFVTPSDFGFMHYYCTDAAEGVSELGFEKHKNQTVPRDAAMCVCIGNTIGKCAIAPEPCLTNQQINSVIANENNDPKFLYYLLCNMREQIRAVGMGGGSAQPIINKSKFSALEMRVPDFGTQRGISEALFAYDDLIENNRQRIALLEEAARLLYREWFVHFRFPGHEHVQITDSLPEGWESVPVRSVCNTYDDGDWLETKDQGGSDYRILQISNIGSNSFVETGNWRYITEETFRRLNCHEVVPGDILVSRMPRPIGRGWMVTPMPFRMVTAVDVTIVRADQSRVEPYLLLHHINSDQNVGRCEANATGATRPRISRKSMGNLSIILSPMELQHQFAEIASENNRLRENLFKQNEGLAKARDLLLPRLMNGEIAV